MLRPNPKFIDDEFHTSIGSEIGSIGSMDVLIFTRDVLRWKFIPIDVFTSAFASSQFEFPFEFSTIVEDALVTFSSEKLFDRSPESSEMKFIFTDDFTDAGKFRIEVSFADINFHAGRSGSDHWLSVLPNYKIPILYQEFCEGAACEGHLEFLQKFYSQVEPNSTALKDFTRAALQNNRFHVLEWLIEHEGLAFESDVNSEYSFIEYVLTLCDARRSSFKDGASFLNAVRFIERKGGSCFSPAVVSKAISFHSAELLQHMIDRYDLMSPRPDNSRNRLRLVGALVSSLAFKVQSRILFLAVFPSPSPLLPS